MTLDLKSAYATPRAGENAVTVSRINSALVHWILDRYIYNPSQVLQEDGGGD